MDRHDPESARTLLERSFPHPKQRTAILRCLAASVRLAHKTRPDAWSITLARAHVRLNVGWVELMVLRPTPHFTIYEGEPPVPAQPGAEYGGEYPLLGDGPSSSVSCAAADFQRIYEAHAAEHALAIARGAVRRPPSQTRSAHSPGVLRYVEAELGETLPDPVTHSVEEGDSISSDAQGRSGVGQPYVNVEQFPRSASRDPFEVDPDKVDRGNWAHVATQNALADFLRARGLEPRAPNDDGPEFDLAWEVGEVLYVAEVKSATQANEEKQLRLGLGQILRYRNLLRANGRQVMAVLVPERQPTDSSWVSACAEAGVVLTWPGSFQETLQP